MDLISDLLQLETMKDLAITQEQRGKLEEIRFSAEKESIQHRCSLRIRHLELSHLLGAENPDPIAIDKEIQNAAQEEASLMRSLIHARLNARAVLTAEQRTKFVQRIQNRLSEERRLPGPPALSGERDGIGAPSPVAPGIPQAR